MHCLEAVLRGPSNGTVLTAKRCIELQGKQYPSQYLNTFAPHYIGGNDDNQNYDKKNKNHINNNDQNNNKDALEKGLTKVIIVEKACRCARITRFIARVIDFLIDSSNIFRNWLLYKYFIHLMKNFCKTVGLFGQCLLSLKNNLKKLL